MREKVIIEMLIINKFKEITILYNICIREQILNDLQSGGHEAVQEFQFFLSDETSIKHFYFLFSN